MPFALFVLIGTINAVNTKYAVDAEYTFYSGTPTTLVAHFTEVFSGLLGDVDFDGDVDVTDALLTMRYAMGIIEFTPEQLAVGDMDSNGTVNITDAVIILRIAMGLR